MIGICSVLPLVQVLPFAMRGKNEGDKIQKTVVEKSIVVMWACVNNFHIESENLEDD